MRIAVVGAGAVGLCFGGWAAEAGHEVTFVARGEARRLLESEGLFVEGPAERRLELAPLSSLAVAGSPSVIALKELPQHRFDLVLVTVKSAGLDEVAPFVADAARSECLVVPLLNGLDSEAKLAEVVPRERIVGGIVLIAAERTAPNRALCQGGGEAVLAPLDGNDIKPVQALASKLQSAFSCRTEQSLAFVLWHKLLWNAAFNGVCALTGLTAGEVLDNPELADLVLALMKEVVMVANAEGVPLDEEHAHKHIEATKKHYGATVPSMLQDVLAGRLTERDVIYGGVITRGERHGLACNTLKTVSALLGGREHGGPAAEKNRRGVC